MSFSSFEYCTAPSNGRSWAWPVRRIDTPSRASVHRRDGWTALHLVGDRRLRLRQADIHRSCRDTMAGARALGANLVRTRVPWLRVLQNSTCQKTPQPKLDHFRASMGDHDHLSIVVADL
jgi:hypothetical protein